MATNFDTYFVLVKVTWHYILLYYMSDSAKWMGLSESYHFEIHDLLKILASLYSIFT